MEKQKNTFIVEFKKVGNKKIVISSFIKKKSTNDKKIYLDIREWYTDKEKKDNPTNNGVSFSITELYNIADKFDLVEDHIRNDNDFSEEVKIRFDEKIVISKYIIDQEKETFLISIRIWIVKEEENICAPTKKGLTLKITQFNKLNNYLKKAIKILIDENKLDSDKTIYQNLNYE